MLLILFDLHVTVFKVAKAYIFKDTGSNYLDMKILPSLPEDSSEILKKIKLLYKILVKKRLRRLIRILQALPLLFAVEAISSAIKFLQGKRFHFLFSNLFEFIKMFSLQVDFPLVLFHHIGVGM